MPTVLAPDDFKEGMYVTVFEEKFASPEQLGLAPVVPSCIDFHDVNRPPRILPPGLPLLIVAVSRPFLATKAIPPNHEPFGPIIIDTRRVSLCRLDPTYMKALQKEFPPREGAVAFQTFPDTTPLEHYEGGYHVGEREEPPTEPA